MTNTIAGTYTTLVTLGTAVDNPTTIASTGLLTDGLSVSYTGLGVVNAGTVRGGSQETGIYLHTAGSVTNQSDGVISGYKGAIFGKSGAVTVVNAGSIAGYTDGGRGVYLDAGGNVTNQSGGLISGAQGIDGNNVAVTVVNAGSITGYRAGESALGDGVDLAAGGSVTNQSDAAIHGGFVGIYGNGAAVTVVNAGSIVAGDGVLLRAGGSITNQSGGAIDSDFGNGVYGSGRALTLVNAGSILGGADGVYLEAGGSVTNQSGGTITGGLGAIYGGRYGAITVVNAGTIIGFDDAVQFEAGYANRLVIDPGAVISGRNRGGNTIGAGQVSTLELASGGSVGTLSGLGTKYTDFAQVTVDAGAQWTLTGANILAAGYTLTDAGTLTNAGSLGVDSALTLVPGGVLSNASTGTITASDGSAVYGAAGGAATVVNAGVIVGADGGSDAGIDLAGGGSVTNQSGGAISAEVAGIGGYNAAVTVVNAGSIAESNDGVFLFAGGSVTNQSGGAISAEVAGISGYNAAVIVVNAGSIAGSSNGVRLVDGGSVTNQSGGTISGGDGIVGQNAAVTVVNAGSITGNVSGVFLDAGGSVTNQSGDAISGGYNGIYGEFGAVTVVNGGTIAGGNYAVKFTAGYANRLIADPGAVFTGKVQGARGVLELASAASAGTLAGFGTTITNFSTLQFDAGSAWTVSGNDSASGLGTIGITGFTIGDTIDLTGFVASDETFANNTLVLTGEVGGPETLNVQGAFTTGSFQLTQDGNGGTDITVVCFCAGTMIGTPAGEVPVEKLNIGDRVLTAHNGPRAVTWIGNGKVLATRGRRSAATPVIVRKDALADNVPNADLHVTKAHSLYIDDVLIPVEFLVNHRTILWDDRAQEVEIYHVELDSHDVLIANGAPAESYRDDGNRWLFQNARSGWDLPPQEPYAPVLTGGPIVDAVWRRLLDRTGPRALPPLTDDPDLHLLVDGTRVDAKERQESVYVFRLPPRPGHVVIASRTTVPAELGIARDPRSLGVALRRLAIRQGTKFVLFDAADERLTMGFHTYEADGRLRWTNGHAELPAEAFTQFNKGAEVMLHLGSATQYPDDRVSVACSAA